MLADIKKPFKSFSPPLRLKAHIATIVAILALAPIVASARTQQHWTSTSASRWAGYEQSMFFHVYQDEPFEQRLQRMETAIYGQARSGSQSVRTARIMQVLAKLHPQTRQATPANNGGRIPLQQKSAMSYPAIDTMESALFHQVYNGEQLADRLSRLENHAFGQAYTNMPLVDRVDRLEERYPGGLGRGYTVQAPQSRFQVIPKAPPLIRDEPAYSQHQASSTRQLSSPSNGQTYRVKKNRGSSKAYQPKMVGMGLSYGENSRSRYSPELLQMLPPDVQQQLGGRTQASALSTVPQQTPRQQLPVVQPVITSPSQAPFYGHPSSGYLGVPLSE